MSEITTDRFAAMVEADAHVRAVLETLVENVDGDIDELVEAAARDYEGAPPQTITWKDPMLLLYHPFYGEGWADTIHATITTTFDRDKLHLDERGGGGGYSFSDEVCGGLVGNNDTTVTITREEA